ncbi:hypothetical protein [Mycolicibacterium hippocampi]|uniref:hypothetical protein n=1 Tax=Mycolicibacterium hippocampi TaxID=659824 RepID=UPI003518E90B
MTDAVTGLDWATFIAASVSAVSAIIAATVTSRSERRENQRTWERDRVTERYTDLQQALQGVIDFVATEVRPALHAVPVMPTDPLVRGVNAVESKLQSALLAAIVVARERTNELLPSVLGINFLVLVPHTPPRGIPPIAETRMSAEEVYVSQVIVHLALAMRVDLGIATKAQVRNARQEIEGFLKTAEKSRSQFDVNPQQVLANLQAYQVLPFLHADQSFSIPGLAIDTYLSQLHLRTPLQCDALLVHSPATSKLFAGVSSDCDASRQADLLRLIGKSVEHGLRSSPGSVGAREMPSGELVYVWSRQ